MPTARFRTPLDAERFCRGLVARGYRLAPAVHVLRAPAMETYRVYRERAFGKPTGWLCVVYWQSRRGPFSPVPEPAERQARGAGKPCKANPDHGKAYSRELCANCYSRWQYWQHPEHRARSRARKRRVRAAAREAA